MDCRISHLPGWARPTYACEMSTRTRSVSCALLRRFDSSGSERNVNNLLELLSTLCNIMASNPYELVSQRVRPKLVHDGHIYVQEKRSKDQERQFYRCQRVGACKARSNVSVETGAIRKEVGTHREEPDPAGIEMARKVHGLKMRALTSQETPLQLIENVFESTSQAAKLIAPSHGTLSKFVNRAKKKASRAPAVPPDRASIVLPDEYKFYESSRGRREKFLIGDSVSWPYAMFETFLESHEIRNPVSASLCL